MAFSKVKMLLKGLSKADQQATCFVAQELKFLENE